ncbi:AsmA-like C-terminal region-containing protein [Halioglobus sp.]|nr:AsmA-like C-terminal region-containing protein [Halioglobus sp.]
MKRLLFTALILLGLGALALWGNRFAASLLDQQLGPLLTRQLGLPVDLAPINANLLQMSATSARLVMGDPQQPSVVATNIKVSVVITDLLVGKVRLRAASADDLTLNLSRWPSSGKPLPDDFHFLDPWIPKKLALDSGRYVTDSGDTYPVINAHWTREADGGLKIKWHNERAAGTAAYKAELASLDALLSLNALSLDITGAIKQAEHSQFSLNAALSPGKTSAYTLDAELDAADTRVTVQASGTAPWRLPNTSNTRLEHVQVSALKDFVAAYQSPGDAETTETFLAKPLPALNLWSHKGRLQIGKLAVDDEAVRDTTLDFTLDANGLRVDSLQLEGPKANLSGKLAIGSSAAGWEVSLDAAVHARAGEGGIGPFFADTDWHWDDGSTQLAGKGTTWGTLLYSLDGHVELGGSHSGASETPVKLEATIASKPSAFALKHLKVDIGEGHFEGTAELSGTGQQHKLTLDLTGETLHLGFLFDTTSGTATQGVALPEYLGLVPSLELDWTLDITDVQAPGLSLAKADMHLLRNDVKGSLTAHGTGVTGGALDFVLNADYPTINNEHYSLAMQFTRLDLPGMFQQPNLLHSRTSGTLNFDGTGTEIEDVFSNLRGTTQLDIEVRPDNNWQRKARDGEQLSFRGNGRFVIEGDDIVGLTLTELSVDSVEQDIDGNVSMVVTRKPWLVVDLTSKKLDLDALLHLLPASPEKADQSNFPQTLRRMGAAHFNIQADSLTVGDAPISDMDLALATDADLFKIEKLALASHGGRLTATGEVAWKDEDAKVELNAQLINLDLDQFLIRDPNLTPVPVFGEANLSSHGRSVSDVIANLSGKVDLASKEMRPGTQNPQRDIKIYARRVPKGVEAEIESVRLGDSYLRGTVRYVNSAVPQLDVTLTNATIDLVPWETRHVDDKDAEDSSKTSSSGISKLARASAGMVGSVLRAPLRLFGGDDNSKKKDRLFSDDPLPLDDLKKIDVTISGTLDSLKSTVITLGQLDFTAEVKEGALDVFAKSDAINGGQGQVDLKLNSNVTPATATLRSDFSNVRGLLDKDTYTRSGFVALTTAGQSTAELAANLDGLLYLELGPGPFNYMNTALLSSNIAFAVFSALLPGFEQQTPQLECGVTVAEFDKGKGKTPFGYAMRTNQANLLGRIRMNLKDETMQLNFESRSREGVGLSVGNVISNSIEVRGSLTNPQVVPRATSLLWRGWAAIMTGGLSIVAEGVLKRAMASEDPCPPIQDLIQKEICPKSAVARSSQRMCPSDDATQSANSG